MGLLSIKNSAKLTKLSELSKQLSLFFFLYPHYADLPQSQLVVAAVGTLRCRRNDKVALARAYYRARDCQVLAPLAPMSSLSTHTLQW
jgi:hypothetical protein